MDRADAVTLARRLAASYPSSRVPSATLDEWTEELRKLSPDRGDLVLDWVRNNVDSAPTFRQLRLAMAKVRPASAGDPAYATPGLDDPCEFCQQPVLNGPDAASRYDREFDRFFNAHLSCADARAASYSVEGGK